MHKLLSRQCKRIFGKNVDIESLDDDIKALLNIVSASYKEYDDERKFVEHTLEVNSQELYSSNVKLTQVNKSLENSNQEMERFHDVVRATEDGIWDWNIVTNEVYYSSAWQTMLGYEDGELEQVVDTWTTLLHPDDLEMTFNHAQKFIDNRLNEYRMEFRMLCKDGSYKWVLARAIDSQRDENNKVTRMIGTHVDIQDKKELEHELIEARETAEAASRAKSDFLANMSHEIRTPMNAVIGMTHLALETDLNEKQKNYISKANVSAENLLGIIDDILDLSKIEAGKLEFEEILFDLKDVIKKTVDMINVKAREKDLSIKVKLEKDLPKHYLGDPLRLGQVLTNLASNAVKFSHISDSISLRVSLVREYSDTFEIKFSIEDNGIGMNEEAQSKLFQAFSQADSSTTRNYGGTGLGLLISKNICEYMGGEIWVESKENEGSTFTFTVMLKKPEQDSLEQFTAVNKDSSFSLEKLKGLKVLLVEDNELNQELAIDLLMSKGMNVLVAENGQEALDVLDVETFDVILMDCQMPVMDGFEATKRIRKQDQYKNLPIIALTANVMKEDVDLIKKSGMNAHIAKPINPDKMFLTIAKFIN